MSSHNIKALWFGDEVSLLGHLHTPRGVAVDLAVVVCAPPFGYENICGHRGLRILGDRLASHGIAALRFDFPGTGDSDGEQRLPAWKAAVADAVATIRRETGCSHVAVVGVGLAGTIALASIDAGLNVDKLVLWAAPTLGRAWLRQQRAYHRLNLVEIDPASQAAPPREEIEELTGFAMSAKLADELAALDVSQSAIGAWPRDRERPLCLAISRTGSDPKNQFGEAMSARGIDAAMEGETPNAFDLMYDQPHRSIAPEVLFARMRVWLATNVASRRPYAIATEVGEAVATRIGKQGLVEEVARYSQGDGGLLFSIETRPAGRDPNPTWLVMLTGRAVRHVGSNCMWVRFARDLAAQGYATLRLDGRSVGDSEGEGNGLMPNAEYYQAHIYDDIERVMEIAVAAGAKQFLMTGLCSGSTASYQVAWRRSDVRAIVMLSPLQLRHDPEDDERAQVDVARRWLLDLKRHLIEPKSYIRVLKGDLPVRMLLDGFTSGARRMFKRTHNEPSYVVTGFHALARRPVEIDVVVAGTDALCRNFLERHFGEGLINFDREHLRLHRVPNCDHTLRPLFAQDLFYDLLSAAIARIAPSKSANHSAQRQVLGVAQTTLAKNS